MGRRTIVLVVALLLAGIASFAVWRFLTGIETQELERFTLVDVYRAQQFIGEGTEGNLVMSQGTVALEQVPEEFVPANAVATEEELRAVLSNAVAAGPISAGSVITTDQWVPITVDVTPMAELIPEGKQAITLQADEVRGVGGFVQPGDRVNMIVTLEIEFRETTLLGGGGVGFNPAPAEQPAEGQQEQQQQESITKTLTRFVLQGLPVLAVGRDIRAGEDEPQTVDVPATTPEGAPEGAQDQQEVERLDLLTLEVSPEQAERLAFASESGSVWLTLVPADFVEVPTDGVVIETLFEDLGVLQDLFGIG